MKVNNPYDSKEEIDFKTVINLTQLLRFKALAKLLKKGIPNESDDREYFLKLMKACDLTALATKKLEGEAALVSAQTEAFNLVSATLTNVSHNPFISNNEITEDIDVPIYERECGEDLIGIDNYVIEDLDNRD